VSLSTARLLRFGPLPRETMSGQNDDDSGLSDSDPDLSNSDDDESSPEDEQGRSSTRKHSAWLPLDEQRLLVYKKEGKSWSWIFRVRYSMLRSCTLIKSEHGCCRRSRVQLVKISDSAHRRMGRSRRIYDTAITGRD
jgi:hypothetical protein